MARRIYGCVFFVWISLTWSVTVIPSCTSSYFSPAPNIPSDYYKCFVVSPRTLFDAYYGILTDHEEARVNYDGEVFVLKNVELTEDQIVNLRSRDYIWVDLIKCMVTNTADCRRYKPGDMVDVVGINQGTTLDFMGLLFTDCYIMPAGSLAIPADDSGQINVVGY